MHLTDSPEYALLRLIGRAKLSPERAASFRAACELVDWQQTMVLAAHHRLVPLFHVHARDHAADLVPEPILNTFRRAAMQRAMQVLFLSSELEKIVDRLESDSIPYLVLKGPSLAEAFGDMSRRPFVDNDLLIRREDFDRVERALLGSGFGRRKRSQRQQNGYLFVHGEYTFGRSVGTQISTVDVHVNLVPRGYAYQVPFDVLHGRSRLLTLTSADVPVLSWEDLFIALSVNALKDQWNRLRLASDLAEVGAFVDWPQIWKLAEQGRCLRAVQLGIVVAADELDAPFPEEVIARARADARTETLSRHVREHLRTFHEAPILGGLERVRLNLLAQDDARSQLRYSSYVLLRRTMEWLVDPPQEVRHDLIES